MGFRDRRDREFPSVLRLAVPAFIGFSVQNFVAVFDRTVPEWLSSDSADFDFERTDAFSFAFWVWVDSDAPDNQMILSKDGGGASYYVNLRGSATPNGKELWVLLEGSTGNSILRRPAWNYPLGQWSHVVATYDGSSTLAGVNVYINGVLDTSVGGLEQDNLDSSISNSAPFEIGERRSSPVPLGGRLDEFGVWGRDLTAVEASDLYNGGAPLGHDNLSSGLLTGLISWYDFNRKPGLLIDSAGGNTLVDHNTVGQVLRD